MKTKKVRKIMKKGWDLIPVDYRNIITGIAQGNKEYTVFDALSYLDEHKSDYKNPESSIDKFVWLLMIEETFGNMWTVPIWQEYEYIWQHEDIIGNIILKGLLPCLIELSQEGYSLRGDEPRTKYKEKYDNLTLVQNSHLYLYYYFRHINDVKNIKKELEAILCSSIVNTHYMLFDKKDESNELYALETIGREGLYLHGFEKYSEPLSSLYFEMLEYGFRDEDLAVFKRYVDILTDDNIQLQSDVSNRLMERWLKRLKTIYESKIDSINDQIEMIEDDLITFCLKRKQLIKEIIKIDDQITIDEEELPF